MRPRRETCAEHRSVMERILVRSSTHSWRYFPHLCQQGQADKKYGVERPTFPVASVKLQPILCVKKYPACSNPLSSISSNTLNNKAVVKSITYIYIYIYIYIYFLLKISASHACIALCTSSQDAVQKKPLFDCSNNYLTADIVESQGKRLLSHLASQSLKTSTILVADTDLLQVINNAVLSTTASRLSRDVTQGRQAQYSCLAT